MPQKEHEIGVNFISSGACLGCFLYMAQMHDGPETWRANAFSCQKRMKLGKKWSDSSHQNNVENQS